VQGSTAIEGVFDMTAQTTTRPATSGVRVAPMIVVLIASIAFVAGLSLANVAHSTTAVAGSATQAAQFNAVQFRAEERDSGLPAPSFDAVQFRAEEHQP
jgi:hypothetical protein